MNPDISWRTVVAGAGIGAVGAVPAALVAQTVADRDDPNGAVLTLLAIAVIVSLGIGGHWAARRRDDAPLSHGALAALVAFAVIQGVGAIRRVVADEDLDPAAVASSAIIALLAGVVGGYVAARRTA